MAKADSLKIIRYPLVWAYSFLRARSPLGNYLNRSSNELFKKYPPCLNQYQQEIVDNLLNNGIGFGHLDDIFPDANVLSELTKYASLQRKNIKVGFTKPFFRYYWGSHLDHFSTSPHIIDLKNPFVQFCLRKEVLDIVNAYMRTCSKLALFELAETSVMKPGEVQTMSQQWHRDPGINRIVKVFIYLTDVDMGSGPFTYLLRSHLEGRWRGLYPQRTFGKHGIYPPDGEVEKSVPRDEIKFCTGRAGTVIFCDTIGLHCGAQSISRTRVMFTGVYVAERDFIKPKFQYPLNFRDQIAKLNIVSRFAVS